MDQRPNIETIKTRYGVVGHNPRLNTALEIATRVAPTDVSVLISGENGTGKDVFSRIIHQNSKRKHQPFMAINTGAIPEGTMDSELFGHEKGSFTGAVESRKGYFEEVAGGTIFMDEISEMPMATQARLLRLLENKEYLRVGSSKVRRSDVRVIAASNKNLIERIRKGKFREDLFFRLNTVTIQVPPLRERGTDIELLFQYFTDEFCHKYRRNPFYLTPDASAVLYQYRWPGNVRELKNFVEKLTVLIPEDTITSDMITKHLNVRDSYLPSLVGSTEPEEGAGNDTRRDIEMLYKMIFKLRDEVSDLKKAMVSLVEGTPTRVSALPSQVSPVGSSYQEFEEPRENVLYVRDPEVEYNSGQERPPQQAEEAHILEESLSLEKKQKELILKSLRKHNNNRKKAAKELGISERTLYRKLKNYGIN